MRKWMVYFSLLPVILLSANGMQKGNSLYGSSSKQGQVADCSHLTQEEQAFAAKLSSIHRNVFCDQFSPSQRQDAMQLTKMKDPLNTTPGKISPDHAVEIVLQSSRNSDQPHPSSQNQQQMPYGQQQQQMPYQQQPQSPYRQNGQGQQQQQQQLPPGCKRY